MATAVTENPGELIAQAEALEARADAMMAQVRELRADAAKRRARAERLNMGGLPIIHRVDRDDPLIAAAGLAAEDLPGTFQVHDLCNALEIKDHARGLRLLIALRELGHVQAVHGGGWRSVDPEAARVRDMVIELGEFTREELADRLAMHPTTLRWYLADLRQRGVIGQEDADGRIAYQPTGSERVVTRRRRQAPPEAVLGGDLAAAGGKVVEFTGKPMVEPRNATGRRKAGSRKSRGGAVKRRKQS